MKHLYAFLLVSLLALSAKAQYQSELLYQPNGNVSLKASMFWPCPPNSCPYLMYHNLTFQNDTVEVHTFYPGTICNAFLSCMSVDTIDLGVTNRDSFAVVKMLIHIISKVNATDWDTTYNAFSSKYFQIVPLSSKISTLTTAFTLYPNPAKDKLILHNQYQPTKALLSISDITGRAVMEQNAVLHNGNTPVDVSALSPGIYYISLRDEEKIIYQGRFVKE